MMYYNFPFFGGGMPLYMIAVWVIIVVAGAVFVAWLMNTNAGRTNHMDKKTPLEILKERYAKGEINQKEFEVKKKDLV